MDPISAGASVLAIIGVGRKAAKAVHAVFSGLKDGPQDVQRASINVQGLISALERLSESRVLEDDGDGALSERMLRCVDDVEAFAAKLGKLTISDAERRRGKYWKKLRTILNENDLDEMNRVVLAHTSALNLELNALQSDVVLGIPDKLQAITRLQETQDVTWREQRTTLGTISDVITTSNVTIVDGFQSLTSSSVQTQEILRQLLEMVVKLSVQQKEPEPTPAVETHDDSSDTPEDEMELDEESDVEEVHICSKLTETISRLCDLVRDKQGRPAPGESGGIIESLIKTLEFLRSGEFLEASIASRLMERRICSACQRGHLADLQAGLTSVYVALLSVRQVILNEPERKQAYDSRKMARNHWKSLQFNMGIGTLTITTCTRSWDTQTNPDHTADTAPFPEILAASCEEITTSISLVPRLAHSRQAFTLRSRKYNGYHGVFSTIPQLAVNRILPANAPVFSIVRTGRLDEFQKLLRGGQASLRDHDEYGASLLHYANRQPEMCRFLIENGADVNHVADCTGIRLRGYTFASVLPEFAPWKREPEEVESLVTCRKYILEAGCDPTLPLLYAPDSDVYSALVDCLSYGTPDEVRLMLDAGGCFVDVTKPFVYGTFREYALHTVLRGPNYDVETISFLLDRGASVDQHDGGGRTCLHFIFKALWLKCKWGHANARTTGDSEWIKQVRDAVILLIQRGADVYAIDDDGWSVSDTAYDADADNGSARGDVWDCALTYCGFDINQFRKDHPRQARYSRPNGSDQGYGRREFEALWAGRENDCPYYDDEFLPWEEDSDDSETMSDATSSDSEDGGTFLDEDEEEDPGVGRGVTSGD